MMEDLPSYFNYNTKNLWDIIIMERGQRAFRSFAPGAPN